MNREEEIQKEIEKLSKNRNILRDFPYERHKLDIAKAELKGIQETEARILGIIDKALTNSPLLSVETRLLKELAKKIKEMK